MLWWACVVFAQLTFRDKSGASVGCIFLQISLLIVKWWACMSIISPDADCCVTRERQRNRERGRRQIILHSIRDSRHHHAQRNPVMCHMRRRIHACVIWGGGYMHVSYEEEDTCMCHMRRRIHALSCLQPRQPSADAWALCHRSLLTL